MKKLLFWFKHLLQKITQHTLRQIWQITHHDVILIMCKILSQCFGKEKRTERCERGEEKVIKAHFMHLHDTHFITPAHYTQNLKCAKNSRTHYHI